MLDYRGIADRGGVDDELRRVCFDGGHYVGPLIDTPLHEGHILLHRL